jgi:hypothetical protein
MTTPTQGTSEATAAEAEERLGSCPSADHILSASAMLHSMHTVEIST